MAGGKGKIKPEDGRQFSKDYQPNEKWTEALAIQLGEDFINWIKAEDENIFVDDFLYLFCDESKYIGRIYATLPNYLCQKFTSFSNLYEKALKMQETKLKKFGAFDKLNASITKFVLQNNHGWKEKTDVTTNDKDVNPNTGYDLTKLSEATLKELLNAQKLTTDTPD